MLILTPFSNLLFTFVVITITGTFLARAYPHSGSDIKAVQNRSIANSDCMGNWAGAVQGSSGSGWKKVSGHFVVPKAITSQVSADIWVGIGSCNSAFFQVGIKASLGSRGNTRYSVFAQWSSEKTYYFENFPINAGDRLVITAEADSRTSGTAYVQSVTKGITRRHGFTSTSKLSFSTAEWVVEPHASEGTYIQFGSVSFTGAQATAFDGTSTNGYGSTLYDYDGGADVFIDQGDIVVLFNS